MAGPFSGLATMRSCERFDNPMRTAGERIEDHMYETIYAGTRHSLIY